MALGQGAIPADIVLSMASRRVVHEQVVVVPYRDTEESLYIDATTYEDDGHKCLGWHLMHSHPLESSVTFHNREAYLLFMEAMRDAGRALGWVKEREARVGLFGELS